MTTEQKQQIADQGSAPTAHKKGARTKQPTALNGVSSATISKVLSDSGTPYPTTCGAEHSGPDRQPPEANGWQVVKTRAYDVMTFTLASVQADSLTAAVIGGPGAARPKP